MPAYFRPLTGSRLYAQSLGSESAPYIVAAMFTEDMKGHADRLKSSLEKIDLNFVLYQVPMVHCSINARGTTDITFCKPNFIQHVQNAYQAPVLYVDVDIIFREPPLKILQAVREHIDSAIYNWLADVSNDAYIPVNISFNGAPSNNRFYRFSHAIDMFDPTQINVSGAVQYYTPKAQPLLLAWFDTINRFPNVDDDELLDCAYNLMFDKSLIRASWWDKDYCRYPWWIHVRPVIDHPEFPAAADNPMRSFQSVTGRRRFKLESVKRRLSLGPFPRDCLIDTSTKCLLRLDPGGRVHVVGRFTIDLWIEPGN